jgi:hypothetical protein
VNSVVKIQIIERTDTVTFGVSAFAHISG